MSKEFALAYRDRAVAHKTSVASRQVLYKDAPYAKPFVPKPLFEPDEVQKRFHSARLTLAPKNFKMAHKDPGSSMGYLATAAERKQLHKMQKAGWATVVPRD